MCIRDSVHFNPTWTYRQHKTQRSTQKALDRRYPGLVWYVNSGLHPRSRRQSTMAICCVGVSGLQSSAMRKELVVVVVLPSGMHSCTRSAFTTYLPWIIPTKLEFSPTAPPGYACAMCKMLYCIMQGFKWMTLFAGRPVGRRTCWKTAGCVGTVRYQTSDRVLCCSESGWTGWDSRSSPGRMKDVGKFRQLNQNS